MLTPKHQRIAAALAAFSFLDSAAFSQKASPLYGTYSNLRFISGPDDTVGYELTILPAYGGDVALFSCAQGEPREPSLVHLDVKSTHITFSVKNNADECNGDYTATLTPRGLTLTIHDSKEVLPRRARSYWAH